MLKRKRKKIAKKTKKARSLLDVHCHVAVQTHLIIHYSLLIARPFIFAFIAAHPYSHP